MARALTRRRRRRCPKRWDGASQRSARPPRPPLALAGKVGGGRLVMAPGLRGRGSGPAASPPARDAHPRGPLWEDDNAGCTKGGCGVDFSPRPWNPGSLSSSNPERGGDDAFGLSTDDAAAGPPAQPGRGRPEHLHPADPLRSAAPPSKPSAVSARASGSSEVGVVIQLGFEAPLRPRSDHDQFSLRVPHLRGEADPRQPMDPRLGPRLRGTDGSSAR